MIGIDTNVLVRILVADDAEQTATACCLLEEAEAEGAAVFVPVVVVVETAWVLRSVYRLDRREISAALAAVMASDQIEVESSDVVFRALHAYESGRADLADHVAREATLAAGGQALVTFDAAARSEPGFVSPDPKSWPDDLTLREAAPRYRGGRRRPAAAT